MRKSLGLTAAASFLSIAVVANASPATASPVPRALDEAPIVLETGGEPIDDSVPARPEDGEAGDIWEDGPDAPPATTPGTEPDDSGPPGRVRPGGFLTVAENPHIAHSPGPIATQAHGCWKRIAGGRPGERAKVTIWLQMYKDGRWQTVDKDQETVKPGCGRGKRATARFECRGIVAWRDYRSIVDVDIIGVIDSDEKTTSTTQRLFCWG